MAEPIGSNVFLATNISPGKVCIQSNLKNMSFCSNPPLSTEKSAKIFIYFRAQ